MSKQTLSNAGWFIAGLSIIGSAWVLSGAPAVSAVSTQAAVAATAAPAPAGLPEFRDIVKDNQASIVRISTKQSIRGASLGEDEAPFGEGDDDIGVDGEGENGVAGGIVAYIGQPRLDQQGRDGSRHAQQKAE